MGGPSRVWMLQPGDTGLSDFSTNRVSEDFGVIVSWDAKQLVLIRPGSSNRTTIGGDSVIRIEPGWKSPDFQQVHDSFCSRDFSTVITAGQKVLKLTEIPQWQQRLVVAEMVEAATVMEKWQVAGQVFGFLAKDSPPQLLLSTIPLPWSDEAAKNMDRIAGSAAKWMTDPNESMQLLGAGWGLSGNDRSTAIEILGRLSKSSTPVISAYAKCQLWRTVPPATVLSEHYAQWISQRDNIFFPAQAGPTMLLADRLERASQGAVAIPEWLRVSTLHADRVYLAKKSVENAARELRSMGRTAEAESLLKRTGH